MMKSFIESSDVVNVNKLIDTSPILKKAINRFINIFGITIDLTTNIAMHSIVSNYFVKKISW